MNRISIRPIIAIAFAIIGIIAGIIISNAIIAPRIAHATAYVESQHSTAVAFNRFKGHFSNFDRQHDLRSRGGPASA